MTRKKHSANKENWKVEIRELLRQDTELLKALVQEVVQQVLEAEMEEAVGAEKGERTPNRLGYRAAYYGRSLVTRVGKLELRAPQDRQGGRTEVFERWQRSEKALVTALMEMYLQGVSTRKVKAVAEELCGHEFSSATISRMVQQSDGELEKYARRRLEEAYPYLILDARHEKAQEDGAVRSQAVLVAIGVNWEGRRCVLGVELANRKNNSRCKELPKSLRQRGLHGVEFVVSDDHAGLRRAIQEMLPEAVWQRCYVHFLRNALDYLPRKADDDCLTELRWIYDRRNLEAARQDVVAWPARWSKRYPKLCNWVEENIEEPLSFYGLPRQHYKYLKSTNMLERLMEEIKRRTLVVRSFPNVASCLRLIRTLAVEMHENWIEATRHLNLEPLAEQGKEALWRLGEAA